MKHRKMTAQQRRNAQKSAKQHGRSQPGLWENVNASKGRGPKANPQANPKAKKRAQPKGKTRPGQRSHKKKKQRR